MQTVTIVEAGEQFARLMEQVEHGETIQIVNGGKPVGRLVPIHDGATAFHRVGFLKGQGHVPANWKELGHDENKVD